MTKYFKAEVTLCQTVTVNVAADSEDAARQQARDLAIQKTPGANVAHVDLRFEGEAKFHVGAKVKHFLFGEGAILNLTPISNADHVLSFRATIRFADGDTKEILLPLPKDKLEVLAS